MPDLTKPDVKESKRSALSFILWWRPDPEEIRRQVEQYKTLRLWHSARGISALLCGFAVAVTILFGTLLMNLPTGTVIGEAVIWGSLGLFMLRGHRWAFLTGMVLWTIEKGFMLVQGAAVGRAPIVQVIWWAVYMGAFYQGLVVERRRASQEAVGVHIPAPDSTAPGP